MEASEGLAPVGMDLRNQTSHQGPLGPTTRYPCDIDHRGVSGGQARRSRGNRFQFVVLSEGQETQQQEEQGSRRLIMADSGGRTYGAGDGIRTRDIDLGKVALYQLSYSRPTENLYFPSETIPVSNVMANVTEIESIYKLAGKPCSLC